MPLAADAPEAEWLPGLLSEQPIDASLGIAALV